MRRAEVRTSPEAAAGVAAYLPDNYRVTGTRPDPRVGWVVVIIEGEDVAGWTLDDYVLPRLASGLYFGREVE
jgi:hypothetical protein